MDDSPSDDSRLGDAEARMRRALGLGGRTVAPAERAQTASSPGDPFSHRRKFVRDGEVPVTVIRQTNSDTKDQLEAARNAMRSLAAAKERTERLLAEAQAAFKDLQTKLGHERLARDEAVARAQAERNAIEQVLQSVRADLAAEVIAREHAEQALRGAQAAISRLTEKLQDVQQAAGKVEAGIADGTGPRSAPRQIVADHTEIVRKIRAADAGPRGQSVRKSVREKPARKPGEKPVRWW